jgi:hypothetical protein
LKVLAASQGKRQNIFQPVRRRQKVFAGLAAFRLSKVTAEFFRLLGVRAALGRAFLPEEEQAGRGQVVVLGYGLGQAAALEAWQQV